MGGTVPGLTKLTLLVGYLVTVLDEGLAEVPLVFVLSFQLIEDAFKAKTIVYPGLTLDDLDLLPVIDIDGVALLSGVPAGIVADSPVNDL